MPFFPAMETLQVLIAGKGYLKRLSEKTQTQAASNSQTQVDNPTERTPLFQKLPQAVVGDKNPDKSAPIDIKGAPRLMPARSRTTGLLEDQVGAQHAARLIRESLLKSAAIAREIELNEAERMEAERVEAERKEAEAKNAAREELRRRIEESGCAILTDSDELEEAIKKPKFRKSRFIKVSQSYTVPETKYQLDSAIWTDDDEAEPAKKPKFIKNSKFIKKPTPVKVSKSVKTSQSANVPNMKWQPDSAIWKDDEKAKLIKKLKFVKKALPLKKLTPVKVSRSVRFSKPVKTPELKGKSNSAIKYPEPTKKSHSVKKPEPIKASQPVKIPGAKGKSNRARKYSDFDKKPNSDRQPAPVRIPGSSRERAASLTDNSAAVYNASVVEDWEDADSDCGSDVEFEKPPLDDDSHAPITFTKRPNPPSMTGCHSLLTEGLKRAAHRAAPMGFDLEGILRRQGARSRAQKYKMRLLARIGRKTKVEDYKKDGTEDWGFIPPSMVLPGGFDETPTMWVGVRKT